MFLRALFIGSFSLLSLAWAFGILIYLLHAERPIFFALGLLLTLCILMSFIYRHKILRLLSIPLGIAPLIFAIYGHITTKNAESEAPAIFYIIFWLSALIYLGSAIFNFSEWAANRKNTAEQGAAANP